MGFAKKITITVISILILVGGLIGVFSYSTAYRQVEKSVGVETVGCANITTGLVNPKDIEELASGNTNKLKQIEEQLNWTVAHKSLFKEVFILSLDGKIIAADENIKKRGYKAGDDFYFDPKAKKMITEMKHSAYTSVYTYDNVKLLTGYGPIYKNNDSSQEIVGLMAINFDASIIWDRTWEIITLPFIIGAVVFLLAAIALYFFIHHMASPIEKLSKQVKQISHGDLTITPLLLNRNDEVGQLSKDFGVMTENLRQLILKISETSEQVSSSAHLLSTTTEQTGKAAHQTVQVTEELAAGAEKQLINLQHGTDTLNETTQHIDTMVENARHVTERAQYASTTAQEGSASLQQSIDQMNIMEQKIVSLSHNIVELSSHSQEIHNIVNVITDIAAETQLLAINAAIEAAQAGEHGGGFSVVAASVRKLADRSKESANQIRHLIEFILSKMEETGETMEWTAKEVAHGTQLVRDVGGSLQSIEDSSKTTATAMEELTATVTKVHTNATSLVQAIDEIVLLANHASDGTHSMSAASEQQLAATQEVEASANFLSGLSDKLRLLVKEFRV
ncbi:methyl-accepting chemotaxis protein [Paenibacillus turicensis]|uniref:Methyl-accepting chemotaxis protein n=1 Tax=Paenibacillus turicensis TaxID=160487 RepID=A0ABS4FLY2_9BACL|nr:methyl-accepting chemotaxis protein [Paenibacillus turicensis]MBP1903592.1 methyl-accepting chemotaxis protein [Paenibacillus turicensis]